MAADFGLHLTVDLVIFILSIALTAIVLYFRRLFKGSIFDRSWNVVLVSAVFLFAGVVVDAIFMGLYGAAELWMEDVEELFVAMFLAVLCYGLYLMARQWRTMGK